MQCRSMHNAHWQSIREIIKHKPSSTDTAIDRCGSVVCLNSICQSQWPGESAFHHFGTFILFIICFCSISQCEIKITSAEKYANQFHAPNRNTYIGILSTTLSARHSNEYCFFFFSFFFVPFVSELFVIMSSSVLANEMNDQYRFVLVLLL